MQVIFETERLFLRKMTMEDFDSLYVVLADSDIMQHYPYSFDEKRVREWIGRNMKRYEENGFGLWAVCLKDTSYCKYTNIPSIKTAEAIGMHFDKEYPDEANEITHVSVIYREDMGQ